MADMDHMKRRGWRERPDDPSDLDLDAALAKYSAVEPRTGLEERVLARLSDEKSKPLSRPRWYWSLAAAAAAIAVMVVAFTWKPSSPSRLVIANHPAGATQTTSQPGTNVANRNGSAVSPRGQSPARRTSTRPSRTAVVAAAPKLDQFPSPQPLSEQEEILKNYVAKYPEQAVLIARAAAEAQRQDQLEETRVPFDDWATDSEEPNHDTTNR